MDNSVQLTEKYRPNILSDLIYQEDIVKLLKSSYKNNSLPHLLFHGPPGTGKTTSIIALCRHFYGSNFNNKVLELNASDDRGITVIRKKIKEFAKISVSSDNPNFKIIILDEADFLTGDAQSALRRCIEEYSHITRFCIICNYLNKIITPIQSRCTVLYFKHIPKNIINERLKFITNSENISITDKMLTQITNKSEGDLRKSINLLELVMLLDNDTMLDYVFIDNIIDPNKINNLCVYAKTKKLKSLSKYIRSMLYEGISGKLLISNILENILTSDKLSIEQKLNIIPIISDSECSIIDGNNEYIQLFGMLHSIGDLL